MSSAQPLSGVKVIELATGVSGPFVGKLFADFGAEVIKVEPSGGDRSRGEGPVPHGRIGRPDPECSPLFLHLNTNKLSVVADLDDPDDQAVVVALAAEADLVIESAPPGFLDARGLGANRLRQSQPGLSVLSITPFGQDGPYAGFVGEDIVTYAMGGPMYSTGVADREPVKLGGSLTSYQVGNLGAAAALAAVTMAEQSGRGTHIDLSAFEAQTGSVDRRVTYLLWHQWSGRVVGREVSEVVRALPNGFAPTADGYVLSFTLPMWIPRMLEVIGDDELVAAFAEADWMRNDDLADEIQARFIPWLYEGDKADRSATAQAAKWAVTPLNAPTDLIDDAHFTERDYFVEVDHPAAGRIQVPGAPFRLGAEWDKAWQVRRPAPLLDEHGEALRSRVAITTEGAHPGASSDQDGAAGGDDAEPEARRLPLDGLRVLDMTVVWAGPSCTMHLSDLGAEVIRVDNAWLFPPATRGNQPRPPADMLVDLGPLGGGYAGMNTDGRPWNKHGMWSAQARNKLSCTLDIRRPEGREAFLRLVEKCDVFVENNSAPTLDKLGIGWDVLHARNPRLIVVRMPPMGLGGRYSNYVGFGASFEALCGLTRLRGYRDDDPTTTSAAFHMDPTTGAAGTFAVFCALRRRERTGVGELVEFSQGENMMHHIGEYLIDARMSGVDRGPGGNRHPNRAPQGCYRCVDDTADDGDRPGGGRDRWVVISVGTDEEWQALCEAMGRPDLLVDERFASLEERLRHHDELDELLGAWTSTQERWEVVNRCQTAGVPAGPVYDEADTMADRHLRERDFFRPQGSADVGQWEFPRHQWRWDGPDMRWGPICRLGVDNDYVLREVAGLSEEEMADLDAGGHLSLDFLQPDGTPY